MLYPNKKKLFYLFFPLLLGCYPNEREKEGTNLYAIERRVITQSQNLIGKEVYNEVHQAIKDSLKNWQRNNVKAFPALELYPYKLDNVMCFNRFRNKLVTTLLLQCNKPNCTQDDIWYLYGVAIEKKWYFFVGATMVISRKRGTSLSFEQLHEIAIKNAYRNYLKKSSTGKWEINDSFFERIEFQYEKWAYLDSDGNKIDNSTLSRDSLTKLFLKKAVYEKWRVK